ncbi:MAG: holo-ACP synthase [Lacunisphaera sp.]
MSIVLPPGGVLIGLGCDIIETERIRSVLEKHGERFLKRVFTEEEQAYCNSIKYPHKHYAARWAAKEASPRPSPPHRRTSRVDLGVGLPRLPQGTARPPRRQGRALLAEVGATHVWLTLSHIDTHAMAVAALVRHA